MVAAEGAAAAAAAGAEAPAAATGAAPAAGRGGTAAASRGQQLEAAAEQPTVQQGSRRMSDGTSDAAGLEGQGSHKPPPQQQGQSPQAAAKSAHAGQTTVEGLAEAGGAEVLAEGEGPGVEGEGVGEVSGG